MARFADRLGWAVAGAVAVALITALAQWSEAGPLNPPGPPGETSGVRLPGTPITSLPYTISAPGNYYFTGNLVGASGQNGVIIGSSNVTLDLNGFTLQGGAGSFDGVHTFTSVQNVTIRNGVVTGWGNEGIDLFFAKGARIYDIQVSNNGALGVKTGLHGTIERCTVFDNGSVGIFTDYGVVRNCVISGNDSHGVQATSNSVIRDNLVTLQNNTSPQYGVQLLGDESIVEGNQLLDNWVSIRIEAGGEYNVIRANGWSHSCCLFTIASDAGANNLIADSVQSGTLNTSTNPHANYFQ